MLTNATLKGTWAPVQQGKLGGERGDDSYRIARVEKREGGKWSIVSYFPGSRSTVGVSHPRHRQVRRRYRMRAGSGKLQQAGTRC